VSQKIDCLLFFQQASSYWCT